MQLKQSVLQYVTTELLKSLWHVRKTSKK